MMLPDEINLMKRFKPTVFRYTCVNSTNDTAKSLWKRFSKEGIVVTSTTQRQGRGRKKRRWTSGTGGLYLSIVLTPPHRKNVQLLTFIAASAICQSLHNLFQLQPAIKWPNDVLIKGKKIGGILAESILGEIPIVILGIGINLNQKNFPPELKNTATSIFLATKKKHNQKELEEEFLNVFKDRYEKYCVKKFSLLLKEWKKWDMTKGAQAIVRTATGKEEGIVKDITDEGGLLLKTKENTLLLHEGEVTIHQLAGKRLKNNLKF